MACPIPTTSLLTPANSSRICSSEMKAGYLLGSCIRACWAFANIEGACWNNWLSWRASSGNSQKKATRSTARNNVKAARIAGIRGMPTCMPFSARESRR